MKILITDGLHSEAIEKLKNEGFEILEVSVAENQLGHYLNKEKVEGVVIRSATKLTKEIIDQAKYLRFIGRAGAGLDNVDLIRAKQQGITIAHTPSASSRSVAEMVVAHALTGMRHLHDANRNMPLEGDRRFKLLKQSYQNGRELRGKTMGIIGFGRIGKEVAKLAISLGMKILYHDPNHPKTLLQFDILGKSISIELEAVEKDFLLHNSDLISLHVPRQEGYILDKKEFDLLKPNVGIINTSRGGIINEVELINYLENNELAFAGLDVYEHEPTPAVQVLMHPQISLSPHTGGSTLEAQQRIGLELAEKLIDFKKNRKR